MLKGATLHSRASPSAVVGVVFMMLMDELASPILGPKSSSAQLRSPISLIRQPPILSRCTLQISNLLCK